jgi:hypothetical protein
MNKFEHISLAEGAQATVGRLHTFVTNLGLNSTNHSKQRKTAKDCPLVWDTGASFGLTPFRSDFIDYTACEIPVNDIARTNIVIGIGTTLHRFLSTCRASRIIFPQRMSACSALKPTTPSMVAIVL